MIEKPKLINYKGKTEFNTGYSLQKQRLHFEKSRDVTRAFKYPLFTQDTKFKDQIVNAINHDYDTLYGSNSFDNYHQTTYSIIDFWLDSLRLGGLFQPSGSKAIDLAYKISNIKSPYQEVINVVKPELANKIEADIFIELFFIKGAFRSNSTLESIKNKIALVFKEDYRYNPEIIHLVENLSKEIHANEPTNQKTIVSKYFNTPKMINVVSSTQTYILTPSIQPDFKRDINAVLETLSSDRLITSYPIEELIGVGSNGNALSNFLGEFLDSLQTKSIEEIVNQFINICPKMWQGKEKDLSYRCSLLKERSLLITPPLIVNKWSDYRSVFAGKFKAWNSNSRNQKDLQKDILDKYLISLNSLDAEIKLQNKSDSKYQLVLLIETISEVRQIISRVKLSDTKEEFNNDLINDLIARLRQILNETYQSGYIYKTENQAGKSVSEIDKIKPIFKNLPKTTSFYGAQKKEKLLKYDKTTKIIKDGFYNLEKFNESLSIEYDSLTENYLLVLLDKFVNRSLTLNSLESKKFFKNIAQEYTPDNISPRSKFYTNKYTEGKYFNYRLDKQPTSEDLIKWIKEINSIYQGFVGFEPDILIDKLEIIKLILSIKLDFVKDKITSVKSMLNLDNFPLAQAYTSLLEDHLDKNNLKYLINTTIASEIRGAINTYSKDNILVRRVIQSVGSDKLFQIVSKNKTQERKISFGLKLNLEQRSELPNDCYDNIFVNKNSPIPVSLKDSEKHNIFEIRSSKHQIAWLYNILYDIDKSYITKRNEPSIQSEITYKITWDFDNDKYDLTPTGYNLYFIQPVNIKSINNNIVQNTVYMGIDIGEYGVAYTVYDANNKNILECGFIYDRQLRMIKDNIKRLKRKQIKGTFSSIDTGLSRARETSLGTIRNRIHAIALKYNAIPVYERQISAFETGSNRVAKLYDSLKRSDVYKEDESSKIIRKNIWGTKSLFGKEASATGTSQLCSRCKRSILFEIEDENKFSYTYDLDTGLGFASYDETQIHFYIEPNSSFAKTLSTNGEISGKNLKKYAKNFMRPPANSYVIKTFLKSRGIDLDINPYWYLSWDEILKNDNPAFNQNENKVESLSKYIKSKGYKVSKNDDFLDFNLRGNSAIFVCPFSDCNHISDADIQASLNVAIRGVFNEGYYKDKSKDMLENETYYKSIKTSNLYPQEPIPLDLDFVIPRK